jgi:hypothetical protein
MKTPLLQLLFICFIIPLQTNAQSEKDVKENDVPESIKKYIRNNYPESGTVKYYIETEKDSSFYEASFSYKNNNYDLTFNMNGSIYEVEREIPFEEINNPAHDRINKDLAERYSKFKIQKVEEVNPQKDLKYEINVKAKKRNHSGYFELFYNKEGTFLQEEEEILQSIPNNSGF